MTPPFTGGGPSGKTPSKTLSKTPSKALLNAAGLQPDVELGKTKIVEEIFEPKLSGNDLAGLYRQYTHRRVLVSSAASNAEFSFVQPASPEDPLTFEEAAELLKKAATIENFIFVPDETDPNLDILMLATANRPTVRGIGVHSDRKVLNSDGKLVNDDQPSIKQYSEKDQLPEGDEVITYVMHLENIKPADAQNAFQQIIGQFNAFGSITPVPNASAVIITENTSLIRKLIELREEIDKPTGVVASAWSTVEYADVTEIAQTLTELFTAQASSQKTGGVQQAPAPAPATGGNPAAAAGAAGAGHSGGSGGSVEDIPVQIIPEPRTNRIFIMARPIQIKQVQNLIKQFDKPTSDKPYIRKLRFLTVSDFLPIANDALTRAFSGTGESGGSKGGASAGGQGSRSQTGNRTQQSNTSGSRTGSNSRSSGMGGTSSGFGGSSGMGGSSSGFGGMGGSGGMSSGGSSLNAPTASSAPESILVGRTLLVADNITNSIVIQGPPPAIEIIKTLLDQIDVKPDQIMISAVIGALNLTDSKSLGLDYLGLANNFAGRGGAGTGPSLPIAPSSGSPAVGTPGTPGYVAAIPAVGAFNPGVLAATAGLQLYGKVGNLNAYLSALQGRTDFTVLSKPQVFGSNNQKLTISSGQRIAIPTGSNTYGAGSTGTGSTQIQYQDVVLKLEVIPLVNSKNEITMQIALGDDQVEGTQTIQGAGPGGGDMTVPLISTREVMTTATVANNDTVVLGGLITGSIEHSKSGIPILCDIPYLGRLFSTNTDKKNRSELLIMLQPSIVKDTTSPNSAEERISGGYKAYPSARKFSDTGEIPGVDKLPRLDKPPKNASPPKAKAVDPDRSSGSSVRRSIHPSAVH